MKIFFDQFSKPEGFLGAIAGKMMARSNFALNEWVLSILNPRKNDCVLEIGYGPGVGIQIAAQLAADGFVAGVDPSEAMLRQARRRNAGTIDAGRVELRLGDVRDVHLFGKDFDKVFAVNTIQFWPEPAERVMEIRQVMKSGGVIALAIQPRTKGATDETTKEWELRLISYLRQAAFREIRAQWRDMLPVAAVCVLGVRG